MGKLALMLLLSLVMLVPNAAVHAQAEKGGTVEQELTTLLRNFLKGAARNDAAVFERFFADDLIYTRNSGEVTSKAEILKSVRGAQPPEPGDAKVEYDADNIRVKSWGDTAVVNFRLVQTTHGEGANATKVYYRNTGTFLKRNGKWQVVAWQATKLPIETKVTP